ncbi:MAG TPA: HIT domain-containing protein [Patescibacteria group bacterium]|nr:HIT domain-containing protein [Patescibacteria group bacterium]
MSDCIFCKIANHEAKSNIKFENDSVAVFASIEPATSTHLLIIPKIHITSFMDLEEKHKDVFMQMCKAAQKMITDKNLSGGYKLIFNGGKYQSVPHIHWHLLAGRELDHNNKAESKI